MSKTVKIQKGGETVVSIAIHDSELDIVVVSPDKPEVKPHQFYKDRDTYVECTPQQRKEILRIAVEYGRKVNPSTPKSGSEFPNLFWDYQDKDISGTYATPEGVPNINWLPYSEFVARLKGEWVEEVKPDEPREVKIQFDASRVAEAIRFETRDGREVKCVVVNDVEAEYPVTGYADGNVKSWTKNGAYHTVNRQLPFDLFMIVKEGVK